jgi:hypothetical protein
MPSLLTTNASLCSTTPADGAVTIAPPGAAAYVPDGDCFGPGTLIATTRGLVSVESLHPGDHVCTVLGGDVAAVVWVGRRVVNCAQHPDPTKVWPIRVSANAFGHGMPSTDLVLSPDHAVFIDQVLIPIRLLVNGRTIRQVLADHITYFQIELSRHDVMLANGMPAESWLDAGRLDKGALDAGGAGFEDRARFSNGGGVVMLHPDFSARVSSKSGCAPLVQSGAVLDKVRRRLTADLARRKRRTRDAFSPGTMWPR